ncbi:Ig-like domain repeat protein, partial [Streptomyces sioyaensis]|uniref:Ig-like domain repeat protein n=1 Tax=Streptomyces sioyaensis TaxID=67364 RepID=UPI0036EF53E1
MALPTINVGSGPFDLAISPNGQRVYVANGTDTTVSVIDTSSNTVVATVTTGTPFGVAAINSRFFVSGRPSVVNYANLTPPNTYTFVGGVTQAGFNPSGLAISPTDSTVFASAWGLPGATHGVKFQSTANTAGIHGSDGAMNVSGMVDVAYEPTGAKVYVTNNVSNSVYVVDAATGTTLSIIGGFNNPQAVAVTPVPVGGERYAYVANSGSNNVRIIRVSDNTFFDTVAVGSAPTGVAFSPSGEFAYVTNSGSNTVSIIPTANIHATLTTIPVGLSPKSVVVTPDGKQAYVANSGDNTVSILSVPNLTSLVPNSGSAAGNQLVTINGSGFTGVTAVSFGGTAASFTAVSDSVITATTPAHAVGAVQVQVTTPLGLSNTLTYTFQGSTTSLSSAPDPSRCGETVTLTATVAGTPAGSGTPTSGTVTFFDGLTSLGTSPLGAGTAIFSTSALAVGSHSLTAVYNGNGNFDASTSPVDPHVVGAASTTTTVSATPASSVCGQPVDVCATVAVLAPGSGIPTGSVTFTGPGGLNQTVALDATGEACFTSTTLTSGTVTAVYTPDASCFATSTGTVAVTVTAASTTTTVSATPASSVCGQPVDVCATVAVLPPGSGTPTGSVTFTGPGGLNQTVTLDATGKACFTSTTLTSGTITAVYTPDASCFATSTGTVAVTVTTASTTTTVSATPASSVCGQPVDVCATVAVLAPGS